MSTNHNTQRRSSYTILDPKIGLVLGLTIASALENRRLEDDS